MHLRQREMKHTGYGLLLLLLLGILFVCMQIYGFQAIVAQWHYTYQECIFFIFIHNCGLHALHVLAGVIALL